MSNYTPGVAARLARQIRGSVIGRLDGFHKAFPEHWCGFLDDATGAAEVIADRLESAALAQAPAEQAGRVDEGMRSLLQEARDQIERECGGFAYFDQLVARIDDALAQNTQVEAVAWANVRDGRVVGLGMERDDDIGLRHPLYLHAERARVPEFTPADAALLREAVSRLPKSQYDPGANLAFRFESAFAAPSQPKDAGEVES